MHSNYKIEINNWSEQYEQGLCFNITVGLPSCLKDEHKLIESTVKMRRGGDGFILFRSYWSVYDNFFWFIAQKITNKS